MPLDDLRRFWDRYVVPAVRAWEQRKSDARLATVALCELDNFAERMILFANPGIDRAGMTLERNKQALSVQALAIARDLHDTHKHGSLSRKTATITGHREPQAIFYGALGDHPIGSLPLGGSKIEHWITQDDGARHLLSDIIYRCRDHWREELRRLGALPR